MRLMTEWLVRRNSRATGGRMKQLVLMDQLVSERCGWRNSDMDSMRTVWSVSEWPSLDENMNCRALDNLISERMTADKILSVLSSVSGGKVRRLVVEVVATKWGGGPS